MSNKQLPALLLALLAFAIAPLQTAGADSNIFPPQAAAKPYIDFDGKGFLIDGRRTFIASGGMEYARVPHQLWRDRLLRMKRAGFNTTELYVFWNFHEPKEGQWDFTGDHDLNAYLQLVHQLGMYAIVRVGPYVCAEWDSGGYPVWLRFKPGVLVRQDNPQFLDETFKYYDHVIPIVASNQINHGGAVILVQIENEYSGGWGTEGNTYEQKLRAKVLSLGVEVPTFFSGLHHGSDPAGNKPWDDAARQSPWFTTEFWSVWYDKYGAQSDATDRDYAHRTWKILAFGGNGYNYYMLHGGTDFDTYNDNEVASSYDYGAAIGQGGDLRPMYYLFKRAALFAGTFQDILENSVNSSDNYKGDASNPDVRVLGRTSPAGTIIFLDNSTKGDIETDYKDAATSAALPSQPLDIASNDMLPVVEHFALTPTITIDQSLTQILTSVTNGHDTTLIVYGPARGHGSIAFSSSSALKPVANSAWKQPDDHHAALDLTYPSTGATSYIVSSGGERLQLLAMNAEEADRTWVVPVDGKTLIVSGSDYAGEAQESQGSLTLQLEYPTNLSGSFFVYAPDFTFVPIRRLTAPGTMPTAPILTRWQEKEVGEQEPIYSDASWLASTDPLQMGADGDYSAYAWYRAKFTLPTAKSTYLTASAMRDRMIVFVDGERVPAAQVSGKSAQLDLTAGAHTLAILTTHYGRGKLFGYLGALDTADPKGLDGPVTLALSPQVALDTWQSLPVTDAKPSISAVPSPNDPGWKSVKLDVDIFNRKPGWAWYQTRIPAAGAQAVPSNLTIHFDHVDDNATVFCNGRQIGTHEGWDQGFDLPLGSAYHPSQENIITVLDENTDSAGGIDGKVTVSSSSTADTLQNWRMRGGIGDPAAIQNWTQITPAAATNNPAFFRAHFTGAPPPPFGPHPILRVQLKGLSAGFVWLNGHNLGRYPEKVPVDGLYLPECWIQSGDNTLAIFDEDGNRPTDVSLTVEQAASRYVVDISN